MTEPMPEPGDMAPVLKIEASATVTHPDGTTDADDAPERN